MFSRSPHLPSDAAPPRNPNEKIDSLKSAVVGILTGSEWPSESNSTAKGLLDTVKSAPNVHNSSDAIPEELQGYIGQYITILEDVHLRLKDATSKASRQEWSFLHSMTTNRPSKCTLVLKTCQDDLRKATNSLPNSLDQEIANDSGITPEPSTELNITNQNRVSIPLRPQSMRSEDGGTLDPLYITPQNQDPVSIVANDHTAPGPIRQGANTVAVKTFNGVEIAPGSSPVVRSYVGAVAKVGLAFAEIIQTMVENDDLVNDMAAQMTKLSGILEGFMKKPDADQGEEIVAQISHLHEELRNVYEQVKEWRSLGRFNTAFHARDGTEALKDYQGTIQGALEEMQVSIAAHDFWLEVYKIVSEQLLVSLETQSVMTELKNHDLQEQHHHLLRCLGDGKHGAQENAIEDVICSPGTRLEILEQIDSWIGDSVDRVLWIRGMAGRGKSTIASTVVHSWKYRASCAIFHFHRGQNSVNSRIVCALARQLAASLVPEVRNTVLESVQENEDIADQRLKEQFEALFVASLARLNGQTHPIIFVIDALDECDNLDDAVDLVRLIDRHSASFPSNVKFLLTCRTGAPVLRALEPRQWHLVDLDMVVDVSTDLERFIGRAFQQIRDADPDVPRDWPSSEDVKRLVEMSEGLFQWARTAIKYVSNGSPVDRLRVFLMRPSGWSGLDDLYHQILSKAFDGIRLDPVRQDILYRMLGTLVVASHPVSLSVIAGMYGNHEIFHGINQEYIIPFLRRDILADLNSLLFIPPSPTDPMCLMHTSIHDLLTSKRRCQEQPYYIDFVWHHKQLANSCFNLMGEHLKENICKLSDLSKPSSEVQDILEREVSKALQYCCRAWPIHLTEGVEWPKPGDNTTTVDLVDFESFSKEKVMCWLEVISLVGITREAMNMARRVYKWLLRCPNGIWESDFLATLWNHVHRFITAFLEPISFGPLHVYVSALPHCPLETEMWELYGKYAKIQTLRGPRTTTWESNLWTRDVDAGVTAVAFSPDGQVLASGCEDGRIQMWDTQTGIPVGEPLTGHDEIVRSVCYSSDGKVLASGSDDETIRLWDPRTGAAVGDPLRGHTGRVTSISFSPDGRALASGSTDATIRLWDARTGAALGEPLTSDTDQIDSVCFSPDGNLLASASYDGWIRFWDARTGATAGELLSIPTDHSTSICFSPDGTVLASNCWHPEILLWDTRTGAAVGQPLKGHRDWVGLLCFSPDGNLLASGSHDKTIRLWDHRTGATVGEPFTGHTDSITAMCFSPDGSVLVSGSSDNTIRLWDPRARVSTSDPHADEPERVTSVCFSPDKKALASGYADGTIRLWDTRTGEAVGEPLTGHTAHVFFVTFSPSGNLLASGSDDKTIRLWDTSTRAAVGEPLTGHNDWVRALSFSPDGNLLASGSDDSTIRLWDTRTGAAVGEPLADEMGALRSVCFSPGGNVLASGSDDAKVRLWDTQTGAVIGEPLRGHTDFVLPVSFSPDGKILVSGSIDRTIRLWDPQTGAAMGDPLEGRTCTSSFHFSPDGTILTTNYWDGTSDSWSLTTHQRYETLHHPSLNKHPSFENNWILLSSSRFLWLPLQYWGDPDREFEREREITLYDRTLIVLSDGKLCFFDVSQILPL